MKRTLLALLYLLCLSLYADAQDGSRSLHWRSMDVVAHLDADGRLRVRERQAMVFTGEWNGGERIFNVRPGQTLQLNGISRIDATGVHPLEQGGIEQVDHFDWFDNHALRWRSRLPGDPPFNNQEIVYELDYTLSNVLIANGDRYQLDHDFSFPSRDGTIQNFTLALTTDDVWESPDLPMRIQRSDIQPGSSVVVTMPLEYTGAGAPAGVRRAPGLALRILLALVLLATLAAMTRSFYRHERARRRFEPLVPIESIDAAWLDRHLFSLPAEVVGALWDNSTAAPEVAAMIARMVLEAKLASTVETGKRKGEVLHLELKVERASLDENERRLIDALFDDGATTTSTERIRERYKRSGFNPAGIIRESVDARLKAMFPQRRVKAGWRSWFAVSGVVVLVLGSCLGALVTAVASSPPYVLPIIAVFVAFIAAIVAAGAYRGTVVDTRRKARRLIMWLGLADFIVLAVVLGLFEAGATLSIAPLIRTPPASGLFFTLVMLCIGSAYLVFRLGRTSEDSERQDARRTLASARAYFLCELRKAKPALQDAWFPYLLAFGLNKHIDKWFSAFGGTHMNTGLLPASTMQSTSSSSSPGGWSGGGALFGGGGGFGGGGTGRSWAAAATAMSAGVSAPSSSGGSGGGGGSSGGGGGGGW